MSSLVLRNYGGFPQGQFGPFDQRKNRYHHKEFIGQQSPFAYLNPTRPYHQSTFYPPRGYPQTGLDQIARPSMNTDLIRLLQQLEERYRYEQYLRNVHKMQNRYWKEHNDSMPFATYTGSSSLYFNGGTNYEFIKETRYVPYPVLVGPGAVGLGAGGRLGYGYPPNLGYTTGLNTSFEIGGNGGSIDLPPKIRMIFIPTGVSSIQQPCAGPLTMPPFLFNRMSQPFCSLPPPPPLPQIASLPLSPTVQQMVIQRYANPVAVLPFTSNWQMSQPTMPTYPQQQQKSMMPISAFQSAPQSYMPSADMTMLPPPVANPVPLMLQYSNSNYPSTCRACLPAPPSLDIRVNGHCWIQHCSACHHVPTTTFNPNARPTGGRVTPLLRHPAVSQYIDNQSIQQQQQQYRYPHTNPPTMMRPWLHNTPPLPPGAVIVSDEYITKDDSSRRSRRLRKYEKEHRRLRKTVELSKTTTASSAHTDRISSSESSRKKMKKYSDLERYQPLAIPGYGSNTSTTSCSCTSSTCSLCSSSTNESAERRNTNISSRNSNRNFASQQLSDAVRNVNLRYYYQPQQLTSVYHTNRYLKSSSEDSMLSSNHEIPPDSPLSLAKKDSHNRPPSPIYCDSIEEEKEDEEFYCTVFSTSSQSEKPKEKLITIREYTTTSPSTISTISSDSEFSIISKTCDSISTIIKDEPDENSVTINDTL